MPLPKEQHKYTVDDILALPDGQRAELIDGQIYDMGTPTKKTFKYRTAGVREYWVIDKTLQKVTVFDFENDNMFEYDFTQKIPVLIYDGELEIDLSRFI